jgi:hypothetical protein
VTEAGVDFAEPLLIAHAAIAALEETDVCVVRPCGRELDAALEQLARLEIFSREQLEAAVRGLRDRDHSAAATGRFAIATQTLEARHVARGNHRLGSHSPDTTW